MIDHHNATASLSTLSSDNHADDGSTAWHWASNVDLPDPAGPLTTPNRARDVIRRATSAGRSTISARSLGGTSLVRATTGDSSTLVT